MARAWHITKVVGLLLMAAACFAFAAASLGRPDLSPEVLEVATGKADGGGLAPLASTGVGQDIVYDGVTILKSSGKGWYCSGFTFAVFLETAKANGLLEDVPAWRISQAQREWFGATKESRIKQHVHAMEKLGIGHEVPLAEAKAGDFVCFSRVKSGHSVILVGLLMREGKIVGLRYRSAQPVTDGVGTTDEFFRTKEQVAGRINPKTIVVGRLRAKPWWRLWG